MYIHIGKDVVLNIKNIIGIFDLEFLENTQEYKDIYNDLEKNNNIIDISEDSKKTFILVEEDNQRKGYISNISAITIAKRKNFLY